MTTIVVLVILAGVIITLSVGENGLIARASKATKDYTNSQEKDKQGINDLYGELLVATDGTISGLTVENLKTMMDERIKEKTADLRESVSEQQTKINALENENTSLNTQITALKSVNNSNASRLRIIKRDFSLYGSVLEANK